MRQVVGEGDYHLIPFYQLSHLTVLSHKGHEQLMIKMRTINRGSGLTLKDTYLQACMIIRRSSKEYKNCLIEAENCKARRSKVVYIQTLACLRESIFLLF